MGRKRIVVGTSVMPVMKEEYLPNSIKSALFKALLGKDADVPTEIINELLHSIGIKAEQMYEYASSGKYVHGLPSGNMRSLIAGKAAVKTVLDSIEGRPVLLDYVKLGPPNLLHMGWMRLVSNYGYNPATNRIMSLEPALGTEVYLSNIIIHVPKPDLEKYNPGALEQWGNPPNTGATPFRANASTTYGSLRSSTPIVADPRTSVEFLEVQYEYKRLLAEGYGDEVLLPGTKIVGSFNMAAGTANQSYEYFQAHYMVNGVKKWWMYQAQSGTYPVLDEIALAPPEVSGTFFPFSYFRYEKVSEIANKTTESYKTTKDMVKLIGLNFDEIAEAINDNPEITDVIQAMLVLGVQPNSDKEIEQRYLFEFFENLYNLQDPAMRSSTWESSQREMIMGGQGLSDGWNNVVIDIADKRFRMRLRARGIYKSFVAGSKAPVGQYNSEVGQANYKVSYWEYDGGYMAETEIPIDYFVYQHQLTEGLYEEIRVIGLETLYYVYGEHFTTSDETKNILLIPLDRSIVKDWPILQKEELYARSLHFVFNSMKVIKLAWYQTGIFQVIVAIAAVVISFFLYGADGGSILAAALATGTATAMVVGIIMQTVLNFIISTVIGEILKIAANIVGGEIAILIAVVAAAYGMYRILGEGLSNVPWANNLLDASTNLLKAGFRELQLGLQDSYMAFLKEVEDATKLLDDAKALLDNVNHMNPFVIFGEKPTDFFNRTVHAGNVGVRSIDAVTSYVDISLRLPTLDDTVGETLAFNTAMA